MENSLDMEFQEWEFIPITNKNMLALNEPETENFSNSKNEDDEVLDIECKDIEVLPQSPSINLSNEDQFNIEPNIQELEEHDQEHDQEHDEEHDEEYEYDKDEMVLEKEIEYVKSEVKEKQAFWTIGALCSIAAASICIIVFAGKNNQQHRNNQQKLQFQLYTDEKRIKEAVKQATKMNHALATVRGATTMTRAHISFGGYYDGI